MAVNASDAVWLQTSPGSGAQTAFVQNDAPTTVFAGFECSGALASIFGPPLIDTPRHRSPEVCQSNALLSDVIPRGWPVDALTATDAFAAVDPRVKRVIAILYGGQRPQVARGWIARAREVESVTLVSPRPDRSLTRLAPGTLLIRIVTDR